MREQDTVYAVLLAAGAGARMGENKLALAFGGKTPLQLCYEAFLESQCPPERIVVAVSENTRAQALSLAEKDARSSAQVAQRAAHRCSMRFGRFKSMGWRRALRPFMTRRAALCRLL